MCPTLGLFSGNDVGIRQLLVIAAALLLCVAELLVELTLNISISCHIVILSYCRVVLIDMLCW